MEANLPQVKAEVEAAFAAYGAALVGNDVATLDARFWDHDLTIRYGATESLYGGEEILAFRRARPSQGLERTLRRAVIATFGRDMATANTEFERGGRIGRQSQTWARLSEGWRVVAAHASLLPA